MITTMFFILVPFQKGSVYHYPSCKAYREKGGGVLMSIILPNLNHTFIGPVPVPVPHFGFSTCPIAWYCFHIGKTLLEVILNKI